MPKSSNSISQEIADLERTLREALKSQRTVEEDILLLQREIIGKQAEKKDKEIIRSKGNYNIKEIKIDISLKQKEFWALKGENL